MSHSNRSPIEYRLRFPDLAGHRIHVQMHIRQPDPEGQLLFLPAWIPGSYLIRDFARHIERIQAHCNDHPVDTFKQGDHEWRCAPCPGPLTIDYVVYAWDLSVRAARVDQQYAFFNGTSVFLGTPNHAQSAHVVVLEAPASQPEWQVYTSMPCATEHPEEAQRHHFGAYQAPDYDALIDHPFLLGTPLVSSFEVHGATHELIFTQPVPELDLARIQRDVAQICQAQIEFFEPETAAVPFLDSADRYCFISLVTENGYGGLEHRSSTALMFPRHQLPTTAQADEKVSEGYQSFLGLVSHEYFHTWNVKRIKPAAFSPYPLTRPAHTELLWVFEGFTSYYDDLFTYRSGVVSKRAYLDRLEKIISHVHKGSGRFKQSVAQSSYDAWTRFYKQDENSPNAIVSYYTKGALVALALDYSLQEQTQGRHNLDDVMRYLWQHYGKDYYRGHPRGLQEDEMAAVIQAATGVDCRDFIQRYVHGSTDLPLEKLFATQGIQLRWQPSSPLPSLDARLEDSPQGLRIAAVYEQGAAHRAGLSAGDIIIALNHLRVENQERLKTLLSAYPAQHVVPVHVFRDGVLQVYEVTLFPAPNDQCVLEGQSQT